MREGGLPAELRVPDAVGFVLAGGRSSRMGRDKALIPFAGRPLIERAADMIRACGLELRISGTRADLTAYGNVIPDETPDQGPLSGICSALRHAVTTWGVILSVDQPLVPCGLVTAMLDRARRTASPVTVASIRGDAQTFPAIVRRDALRVLERELNAGRRGCMAAFRTAGLEVLAAEDIMGPEAIASAEQWFWGVNTPEELERMESLLKVEEGS